MQVSEVEQPSPDPFSLAGALLDGKYRVGRVVAEGGFGVVYAGHHVVLDVPIAIKVLKPTTVGRLEEQSERFSREAQTIAKLRHPSIVQVLDAGLWRPAIDGSASATADLESSSRAAAPLAYMVLEWLTGQTLKANLVERRGLGGRSPIETMGLMLPVLDAVWYAHSKHVAHRDLKPSNIMLSPGEEHTVVRVLDFGVAKGIDEDAVPDSGHTQTRGSSHAFSRSYAAPEQLSGGRTGPWTDIHALGLLLTELLTDRAPYGSSDATELYQLVFHTKRPSPARYGVDVGPWQAIIERAVSLKPSQRFADVTALAAALEETLDQATRAFASCQSRADRVVSEIVHSTAMDTSQQVRTASNTFSVFSRERPRPDRAWFSNWPARRAVPWMVALAGVATAGSYFVFTGHRSADAKEETLGTGAMIVPTPELPRVTPAGSPAAATSPTASLHTEIEAPVDNRLDSPPSGPKASDRTRSPRRPASTGVEPPPNPQPAASARTQLPAYVVE